MYEARDYNETLPLSQILGHNNVAELLSDDELNDIAGDVVTEYNIDVQSRAEWVERTQASIDLAMQLVERKNTPWKGASNVKLPMVTIGAVQFHSRIYPEMVTANPAKCKVFGADPQGLKKARATRVAQHMNFQLLEEDEEWEEELDSLLLSLPITGCEFTKSYYNPTYGYPCTSWVSCGELVVPYFARSIRTAPRATHELRDLTPRLVKERMLQGLWLDVDLGDAPQSLPDPEGRVASMDERRGETPPTNDPDAPRLILEQHRYLDLDRDGYTEPYVVTVDETEKKVLRIYRRFNNAGTTTDRDPELKKLFYQARQQMQRLQEAGETDILRAEADRFQQAMAEARDGAQITSIKPINHFTRYIFLPSVDKGVYGRGLGDVTGPLNHSADTLVNQLIDSGTLANLGGGWIGRGAKFGKKGQQRFKPGEYKEVACTGDDLRKNIVPHNHQPPSPVLFNLLSLLIDYTERTTSVTEMMTGKTPGQNTPATTSLTALEEGKAVFSGIFKRVWRSIRDDLRKRYAINAETLDPAQYTELLDPKDAAALMNDYNMKDRDIRPAADPNMMSAPEKRARAGALKEAAMSTPGYNPVMVEKRYQEALGIEDTEEVYPTQVNPETGMLETIIPAPENPEIQIKVAEEERRALEAQTRARQGDEKNRIAAAAAEIDGVLKAAQAMKVASETDNLKIDKALAVLKEIREGKNDEHARKVGAAGSNGRGTAGADSGVDAG